MAGHVVAIMDYSTSTAQTCLYRRTDSAALRCTSAPSGARYAAVEDEVVALIRRFIAVVEFFAAVSQRRLQNRSSRGCDAVGMQLPVPVAAMLRSIPAASTARATSTPALQGWDKTDSDNCS